MTVPSHRPASGPSVNRGPGRRRPLPGWAVWAVVSALGSAGYFVAGFLHAPQVLGSLLYCLVSGGAGVAIWIGIRAHQPRAAAAWRLLIAAQMMLVLGDATYYFYAQYAEGPLSYVQNVPYLAAYPLQALGLRVFARHRNPGADRSAVIDAVIVATGAALLYWVFIIAPATLDANAGILDKLVAVAFPAMDLLVLAMTLRLNLGAGIRVPAFHLMLVYFGMLFCVDTVATLQILDGLVTDLNWPDVGWLGSYVLLGVAALHPSMRRVDEPAPPGPVVAGRFRLGLLAVATLMAPAVLIIRRFQHLDADLLVIAAASTVLFLLVMTRMSGLIAAQRTVAITDGLTGAHTRGFLQETLGRQDARFRRHGGTLGFILVDVDHFKRINDTYGHPDGDRALVEVARRIRGVTRSTDVVARFGGEEFAVVVADATPEAVAEMAERIRNSVAAEPIALADTAIPVTVSVGAACLPEHAGTVDHLVSAADAALYDAKRTGRNRVVLAAPRPCPSAALRRGPRPGRT
jgi:two-component system, cell cycle response regulator